jgi:dsRNA-specific ribonuclease
LQAPKFFSDIIESIIGAIYLDSNGDFDIVRRVLERLDILPILRRIIEDDVDVRHPVSRVANWAAANHVIPEYRFEKADGFITCTLRIDDGLDEREVASATERFRGKASENEVKFRAAEEGIEVFTRGFDDYDLNDEDFDREDYDF